MEELPNNRLVFTAKDYQVISGCSISTSREEVKKIRRRKKLGKDDLLTVFHVSEDRNIPVMELIRRMPVIPPH